MMNRFRQFALASCLLVNGTFATPQNYPSAPSINKEFAIDARGAAKLVAAAENDRQLEDAAADLSYVSGYSIQFQGCHHIQQWNEDADADDEVRLLTKRLVRFRLVPYDQCSAESAYARLGDTVSKFVDDAKSLAHIFNDYGEYIIDLNAFVYAYLEAIDDSCSAYEEACDNSCSNEDDDGNYVVCMKHCYIGKGASTCAAKYQGDDDSNVEYSYSECSAFDWNTDDDAGLEYYFGPYCASQGGEIKMNLFQDNTCSTLVQCDGARGANCYEDATGITLPYTKDSIVEQTCIPCTEDYITLQEAFDEEGNPTVDFSSYDYGYPRQACTNLYEEAGKCEEHMRKGDQLDTACSYIAGVKIITDDGVPSSRMVLRSSAADYTMGGLCIFSTFIGMYVYYLKYKLAKPVFVLSKP